MKPRQTLSSSNLDHVSTTIGNNTNNNRPANLLELISNPPALLYASPVSGMILLFVSAVSSLLLSFFKTIAR